MTIAARRRRWARCQWNLALLLIAWGAGLAPACSGEQSPATASDGGPAMTLAGAAAEPSPSTGAAAARGSKVSGPVAETVGKLRDSAAKSGTAAPASPTLYSTPFIKVDRTARVQVYIRVTSWGPEERQALEAAGAKLDVISERMLLVQAWVPYDKVDAIAALSFVDHITPPSYATPR